MLSKFLFVLNFPKRYRKARIYIHVSSGIRSHDLSVGAIDGAATGISTLHSYYVY